MGVKIGLDCKLYRNSSNTNTPTWALVEDVRDVTLNLEHAEADVTTRGNAGWRAIQSTLKDGSVEFEMLVNEDRPDSLADFAVFRDAWINRTAVDCAILDGLSNSNTSQGLRAPFSVPKITRTEALEDAVKYAVTIRPTLGAFTPTFVTTGLGS